MNEYGKATEMFLKKVSEILNDLSSASSISSMPEGGSGDVLNAVNELAGGLVFAGHEVSDTVPDRINFFEIDLLGNGNKPNLRVVKSGRVKNPGNWDWKAVGSELAYARSNGFKNPNNSPFFDPGANHRRGKPLVQLSFLPPLDENPIKSKKILYVLKLRNRRVNGGSAVRDFRFSTRFSPISLADLQVDINGTTYQTRDVISLASLIVPPPPTPDNTRRNFSDWLVEPKQHELPAAKPYPDSIWACFMFDWTNIVGTITNPASLPEFAIRFNIHVEFRDGHMRNGQDSENWIPIIIDPDVGHPGGNHGGPPTDP